MTRDELTDALGGLDEELVLRTDARRSGTRREPQLWKKWAAAAACLCLICSAAILPGLFRSGGAEQPAAPSDGDVFYGGDWMFGGESRPELTVDGKLYYWKGFAYPLSFTALEEVYVDTTSQTALPDGYEPCGELAADGNCVLKADFDASGTVYSSEETPEAVYVRMDADWFDAPFRPSYIRFVSAALDEGCRIAWDGRSYVIRIGDGTCEVLRSLPEGCESIGTLHYVGQDALPKHDLETNCPNDTYGRFLDGREVLFDPSDPSFLYLYETQHWAGGTYDAWLKCPLRQ